VFDDVLSATLCSLLHLLLLTFSFSVSRRAEGEKKKVQEAAQSSAQHIIEHFERIKAGGE